MEAYRQELKQLKEEVEQIRIFCEAVADAHAQSAKLREILHKEMGYLIYKKSQPWYDDLCLFNKVVVKSLKKFDDRLTKIENK